MNLKELNERVYDKGTRWYNPLWSLPTSRQKSFYGSTWLCFSGSLMMQSPIYHRICATRWFAELICDIVGCCLLFLSFEISPHPSSHVSWSSLLLMRKSTGLISSLAVHDSGLRLIVNIITSQNMAWSGIVAWTYFVLHSAPHRPPPPDENQIVGGVLDNTTLKKRNFVVALGWIPPFVGRLVCASTLLCPE